MTPDAHSNRGMARTRLLVVLLVLAALVAGVIGWKRVHTGLRVQKLLQCAPDLDHDIAHHVISDSDPEWLDYCRAIGTAPLGDAFAVLGSELRTSSYSRFLEVRDLLESVSLRIGEGLTRAYDLPTPERTVRHCRTVGPDRDYELRQMERLYVEAANNSSLTLGDRIRMCDDLARRFMALGDTDRALRASLVAATAERDSGRLAQHRARLVAALEVARSHQDNYLICQILGDFSYGFGMAGQVDSMNAYLDEGIETALRHGLNDQVARLLRFQALFLNNQGRLALALDRLGQALQLCDRPGLEGARARMQIFYAGFAATEGCWDLAERMLRRVPPLVRDLPALKAAEVKNLMGDLDRIRARIAFATGRPEDGARLVQRWRMAMAPHANWVSLGAMFDEWSAGLENCGRMQEALDVCERGVAHCDSVDLSVRAVPLLMRKARLLSILGRFADAARAADRADSICNADLAGYTSIRRRIDILQTLLRDRMGKPGARREIDTLLDQFCRRLQDEDSGPVRRLEVEDAVDLRAAMHEIDRFSPEAGYRFEMAWRSLTMDAGGRRSTDSAARWARGAARSSALPLRASGAHLVYYFTNDILLRWTATSHRVVLDTLPLPAAQCLAQVREARWLLETEVPPAGELLGPRARRVLERLAHALLPSSLRYSATQPIRIAVSPDGPLQALPFEALWIPGRGGGTPLAMVADVHYLNGWAEPVSRNRGPVVVVSNPTVSPDLERRYGWAGRLAGSEAESEAALARWPDAILLSGDRATKDAVMASWSGAEIIYLAAHHVRDPDAPFPGFVPLAAPQNSPSQAAFIEIPDLRSIDLSACRLAVLASCSSGAPYRVSLRPGPSLGDAFLDSGVHAVVESSWDVGDEETRHFMKTFLSNWYVDGDDVKALNAARRQVMASHAGSSPRVWAAWSVRLTEPAPVSAAPLLAHQR